MTPKEGDTYLNEATGRTRIFKNGQWADKTEPHQFQGSSDRWCEICNQPDRAAIHKIQSAHSSQGLPLDQSARIAALQEWLAADARIIQQLNESNNLLSEKIAQLEKENHELTQRIDDYWKRLVAYRQTDASIRQYSDGSWHPAN